MADRSKQCLGMASRISLMVKSGTVNSLPYVSSSLPMSAGFSGRLSISDMEESDVDEAEGRGESEGEATAVDGEERSASVVEVTVRRKTGFLAETAVDVEGAMM